MKKNGDTYTIRRAEGMDVYPAKAINFNGQLYILTNGDSFSATGEFASFIKHYRNNVIFIGEEVGGNALQNTSGLMRKITLPNSQQQVTIPIITYKMNVNPENSSHGVMPDHWVKNTITDELEGKDQVMDFTVDLIKKSL